MLKTVQAIKALSEKLQKTRAQAAPKPKFSFKKKNASAISINDAAELAAKKRLLQPNSNISSEVSSFATTPLTMPQTPANGLAVDESKPAETKSDASDGVTEGVRKLSFSKADKIHISNHSKIHIMLPSSATHATSGTSGTVTNVRDSVIDMSISAASAFANLTLKNIQGSLIVCGHVDGSVHITGVKDSVLVIATRQFRMHESKNVKVYMLCKSRPIIEDCDGIEFAEMPDCYVSLLPFCLVAQESKGIFVLMVKIRPQKRIRMSRTCTTKLTTSSGSRQNRVPTGAY